MTETHDKLAIRLTDVTLELGTKRLFDGLSLHLDSARVAVIGRNGAGKSQLARLVCGLTAPDSGAVTVGGVDVAKDRKAAIGTVGILFQNPDHQIIFPTVTEEMAFGLTQQGHARVEAANRVTDMLARFDRSHWADRAVHTLSQGQRHLVCLMSVLLMQPRVIVLDEPFAGLDMATVLRLTRYLDALPQMLVHITHDLDSIAGYDRVIWVDGGAVQADGSPEQVLLQYRNAMAALGVRDDFADL